MPNPRSPVACAVIRHRDRQRPRIIADRRTTTLDITIQAQIPDVPHRPEGRCRRHHVTTTWVVYHRPTGWPSCTPGASWRPTDVGDIFYRSRMPYTISLLAPCPVWTRARTRPCTLRNSPPSSKLPPRVPFIPMLYGPGEARPGGPGSPSWCALGPTARGGSVPNASTQPATATDHGTSSFSHLPYPALRGSRDRKPCRAKRPVPAPPPSSIVSPLMKGAVFKDAWAPFSPLDGRPLSTVTPGRTLALVGESRV